MSRPTRRVTSRQPRPRRRLLRCRSRPRPPLLPRPLPRSRSRGDSRTDRSERPAASVTAWNLRGRRAAPTLCDQRRVVVQLDAGGHRAAGFVLGLHLVVDLVVRAFDRCASDGDCHGDGAAVGVGGSGFGDDHAGLVPGRDDDRERDLRSDLLLPSPSTPPDLRVHCSTRSRRGVVASHLLRPERGGHIRTNERLTSGRSRRPRSVHAMTTPSPSSFGDCRVRWTT